MAKTSALPTITDIMNEEALEAYKKYDELNFLLSQQPPAKWIKKHPIIKKKIKDEQGREIYVPYEYLPIDKVEHLLRRIFKSYKIEVLSVMQLFNGVSVSVRVHYKDIVTGDWMFHDGVGAMQLQTKSGSSAADFNAINNGAVTMAVPHAKTLAIKDACDMFGDLFGANLNRDDVLQPVMTTEETKYDKLRRLYEELIVLDYSELIYESDIQNLKRIIEEKEDASYLKAIKIIEETLTKIKAKSDE